MQLCCLSELKAVSVDLNLTSTTIGTAWDSYSFLLINIEAGTEQTAQNFVEVEKMLALPQTVNDGPGKLYI